MRILFEEVKKLINIKSIVLVVFVSIIIYQMFIVFEFKNFPNGRPALDNFIITQEMLMEYGKEMDEKEYEHFKVSYQQRIDEATEYLQSQDELVAAGLDTYEKFREADRGEENISSLINKVMFEDYVDVFWEIQAMEPMMETYENQDRYGQGDMALGVKQEARVEQIKENGALTAVFTYLVIENYNSMIRYVAILVFMSIILIIMPLYIRDRKNNAMILQYTTKLGRAIYRKKLLAGLIASFLVISAQLGCFFLFYTGNDTGLFMNLNLNSIFNYFFISWFDLTFLQYILLTVIAIYILGLSLVLIAAWVSGVVPNYMTSIGLYVPLAFVLFGTGTKYLVQDVTNLSLPKYHLPTSLLIIVVLCLALIMWSNKRERIKDIV